MMLPVVSDLQLLLQRLAAEERSRQSELAALEDRVRQFQDFDHPAYEHWRRMALGPTLAALEQLYEELRSRRTLAQRVMDLVERHHLRPREALHVATTGAPGPDRTQERDEVEARRRAKLERKRAERKQSQREKRATPPTPPPGSAARVVSLFRALARLLHPDSSTALRSLAPDRVRTIWDEVQAAYQARNLERLLALSAWLTSVATTETDDSTPAPTPILSLSERYQRLRALDRSCRALERRLEQLAREPAWDFAQRPPRAHRGLKETAARALEHEMAEIREALQGLEDFLASIGPPRPPPSRRR